MTELIVDPGYGPYEVYAPYVSESTVPDIIWSPGYDYNADPSADSDGTDSWSTVPDNTWSPGLDYNTGGTGEWSSSDTVYSPGYDYSNDYTADSGE